MAQLITEEATHLTSANWCIDKTQISKLLRLADIIGILISRWLNAKIGKISLHCLLKQCNEIVASVTNILLKMRHIISVKNFRELFVDIGLLQKEQAPLLLNRD